MQYIEVTFTVNPLSETANDIIAALAVELGFESFVESPEGTIGYIPAPLYNEESLHKALTDFPMSDTTITFVANEMEDKDWNEEWEKNFFEPIVVDNRCVIHSTFHKDYPKATYDIIINPQMKTDQRRSVRLFFKKSAISLSNRSHTFACGRRRTNHGQSPADLFRSKRQSGSRRVCGTCCCL